MPKGMDGKRVVTHTHPAMEERLGLDDAHVIIDLHCVGELEMMHAIETSSRCIVRMLDEDNTDDDLATQRIMREVSLCKSLLDTLDEKRERIEKGFVNRN